MNPPHRAKSGVHHETVTKGSGFGHVVRPPFVEDSVSPNTKRKNDMTYNDQKQDLDASMIILGLGYACSLLVAIGWLATF
jgi:hypothetical protein